MNVLYKNLSLACLIIFATSCMQSPAFVENRSNNFSGSYEAGARDISKNRLSKPSPDVFHEVKKGDTVYSISRKYGIGVNSLIKQNNLAKPYVITEGMNLKISGSGQSFGGAIEFVDSGEQTDFVEGEGNSFNSSSKFSPVVEKDLEDLKPQKTLQPKIVKESQILEKEEDIKWTDESSEKIILPNQIKLNNLEESEQKEKFTISKFLETLVLKEPQKSEPLPVFLPQTNINKPNVIAQKIVLPNVVKLDDLDHYEVSDDSIGVKSSFSPQPQLRPAAHPKPSIRPDFDLKGDKKIASIDKSEQSKKPSNKKSKNVYETGFTWPTKGKVISKFGAKDGGVYNDGINISAKEGALVMAADSGTVVYAGNELKGYGNLILIKHSNGYVTAYAHNSDLFVEKDDVVEKGQKIALVGATGYVSRPQLHFSIRKGLEAIDPQAYLPKS